MSASSSSRFNSIAVVVTMLIFKSEGVYNELTMDRYKLLLSNRKVQIGLGVGGAVIAGLTIYLLTRGAAPSTATPNYLVCDPGPDPYNSTTITVTNNSATRIPEVVSYVFRCKYEPNKIRKGYFYCDSDCNPATNPNCLKGTWDQAAIKTVSLDPGKSVTFTMTVNPCEIAQIDAANPEIHTGESDVECYNTSSQYTNPAAPNWWPGGIAFGIAENSTGYNVTTGTCPQPTIPPTVPPTAPPTQPPVIPPTQPPATPTTRPPQPTAPPGYPTYTPYPTQPPIVYPTATPLPYVPPSTPYPTQPVTGSVGVTAVGILGGIGLLLLAIL